MRFILFHAQGISLNEQRYALSGARLISFDSFWPTFIQTLKNPHKFYHQDSLLKGLCNVSLLMD